MTSSGYLKLFTFLPRDEVDALEQATADHPERREASGRWRAPSPRWCTATITCSAPNAAAEVLFGEDIRTASVDDVLMVFEDAPSTELSLPAEGMALAEMLATVKLVPSKSEAMRLLKSGGDLREQRPRGRRAGATDGRRRDRRRRSSSSAKDARIITSSSCAHT